MQASLLKPCVIRKSNANPLRKVCVLPLGQSETNRAALCWLKGKELKNERRESILELEQSGMEESRLHGRNRPSMIRKEKIWTIVCWSYLQK